MSRTTARSLAAWCTPRRLVGAVLVLLMAAGWWAFLRPSSLGGPLTLVTVSGVSMEPNYHTGDLAVVRETDDYDEGEIIAFRAEAVPGKPGAYVIHRVVDGGGKSGYVTRGDNNDWNDPWRPTEGDVAGELWFAVPNLGWAIIWLAQPVHLAALLAAFAASMTMLGGGAEERAGGKRRPARARGLRLPVGLNHSGAYVGAAVGGGVLAVLVAGSGTLPGSAAHLEVDGGVLQVFEFDGPAVEPVAYPACGDRDDYDEGLYGTQGDDLLRAGNHPQIIVGYGGDDEIYGGNQDDCLVGGAGDDELYGGNGGDILVGGVGEDGLDGGNGKDVLVDGETP